MTNQVISIENASIGFRNFSGVASKFNQKGNRNFCVFLDKEMTDSLLEDGWNVRCLQPKEEGDEPKCYMQVAVSFDNIPPKIVLITSRGKTVMDDSTIDILDWAEIVQCDLIIRPYNWDVNGKTGVKAYVKAMYITIAEDEFEAKYSDTPASAQNSININETHEF